MVKSTDGTIINVFPTSYGEVRIEFSDPFGGLVDVTITRSDALILGSGIVHLGHGGQ